MKNSAIGDWDAKFSSCGLSSIMKDVRLAKRYRDGAFDIQSNFGNFQKILKLAQKAFKPYISAGDRKKCLQGIGRSVLFTV